MCVVGDRTANDRLRVHIMFKLILFLCLPAPKQTATISSNFNITTFVTVMVFDLRSQPKLFFTGLTVICVRILNVYVDVF